MSENEVEGEPMYRIIRFHFDSTPEIMEENLTLAEAQAHCKRSDTKGDGWFDGYGIMKLED